MKVSISFPNFPQLNVHAPYLSRDELRIGDESILTITKNSHQYNDFIFELAYEACLFYRGKDELEYNHWREVYFHFPIF